MADPNINVNSIMKDPTTGACLSAVNEIAFGRNNNAINDINRLYGENKVDKCNKNLINTLGKPVFSEILGNKEFKAETVTVEDTIMILKNMNISNTNNELLSSLQRKRPEEYVNENNKLHILAYASTLIGKCMNAEASLTATTFNNTPVHLDISQRAPKPLTEPKKPNWFVRHFTFLSKSFKDKMNTYNTDKAKYDAEKDDNAAAIKRFDEMNSINANSSQQIAYDVNKNHTAGTWSPLTRQELGKQAAMTKPVKKQAPTTSLAKNKNQ